MAMVILGIVAAFVAGFVGCCLGTAKAIELGRKGKLGTGGFLNWRDVLTISAEPAADEPDKAARAALLKAADESNRALKAIADRLAAAAKESQQAMKVDFEAIAQAGVEAGRRLAAAVATISGPESKPIAAVDDQGGLLVPREFTDAILRAEVKGEPIAASGFCEPLADGFYRAWSFAMGKADRYSKEAWVEAEQQLKAAIGKAFDSVRDGLGMDERNEPLPLAGVSVSDCFHKAWTAAVGTDGYDKKIWQEAHKQLAESGKTGWNAALIFEAAGEQEDIVAHVKDGKLIVTKNRFGASGEYDIAAIPAAAQLVNVRKSPGFSYYPILGIVDGKAVWCQRIGDKPWVNYETGEEVGELQGWIDAKPIECDSNSAAEFGRFVDSESYDELRAERDELKRRLDEMKKMDVSALQAVTLNGQNSKQVDLTKPIDRQWIETQAINSRPVVLFASASSAQVFAARQSSIKVVKDGKGIWSCCYCRSTIDNKDTCDRCGFRPREFSIVPRSGKPVTTLVFDRVGDEFTPEVVEALCGGRMPHGGGFDFDRVECWRLEDGRLEPYEGDEILPGPSLILVPAGGYDLPSGQNAPIIRPGMTPEQMRLAELAISEIWDQSHYDCDCHLSEDDIPGTERSCPICRASRSVDAIERLMLPRPETLHPERARSMPERIYLEVWREHCKRQPGLNYGYGLLEHILNPEDHKGKIPDYPSSIYPRDAAVATTVIQWLATTGGQNLIRECERRLAKRKGMQWTAMIERGGFDETPAELKITAGDVAAKWLSEEKNPNAVAGLRRDIISLVRHFQNNGGTIWRRLEQLAIEFSKDGQPMCLYHDPKEKEFSLWRSPREVTKDETKRSNWSGQTLGHAVKESILHPGDWETRRRAVVKRRFMDSGDEIVKPGEIVEDCGEGYAVKGQRYFFVGVETLASWPDAD